MQPVSTGAAKRIAIRVWTVKSFLILLACQTSRSMEARRLRLAAETTEEETAMAEPWLSTALTK